MSSAASNIHIRTASPDDAAALLAIYAPYVRETAITFEYEVPSTEEFARRITHTLEKYPYLVAEKDHTLLGYAYADENLKHSGIGRLLHDALENALKKQGILNMNACIACTPTEDPHLNNNSVEFHTHMGYRLVGEFYQCGYKFRTWYNMVWMEKQIGEHLTDQPEIRKFRDIESDICYRKFMK